MKETIFFVLLFVGIGDLSATDHELAEKFFKYTKKMSNQEKDSIEEIIIKIPQNQKPLVVECSLKYLKKYMNGEEIKKNILMVLNAFNKRKNALYFDK